MKYLILPLIVILQIISFFSDGIAMLFELISAGSYRLQNIILDIILKDKTTKQGS